MHRSANRTYKTETAIAYTMSDNITLKGVAVFQAVDVPGSGNLGYVVQDGERVSAGTILAEQYTDDSQGAMRERLDRLDRAILLLTKSENSSGSDLPGRGGEHMNYLWAFVVGGTICVVGQLLIDYTKLSPARILTGYVVAGVILSAVGLYDPLVKLAGAGASVPLLGFGHLLAQGVVKAVDEIGLPGVFTGGIGAAAGGITASLVFALLAALVGKSKDQN